VLTHALKVNFWDVDDMANKIVAVLRHPPLRAELRDRGWFEVRGITWDGAAHKCLGVYARAIEALQRTRAPFARAVQRA
jgi:glycosyltransferase involved in cell wall biosynthesis